MERTVGWRTALIVALAMLGFTAAWIGPGLSTLSARQNPELTPGVAEATNAPVAIHNGTCARFQREPVYDVGTLEFQPAGINSIVDDLRENELLGGPAADGRNDTDSDGGGVLDPGEANYLDEDLNGDGLLDAGEDLDGDGLLDRGIDVDADGVIDEPGRLVPVSGPDARIFKAEDEVDATFDDLFGSPNTLVVHKSADAGASIIACGELTRAADVEDEDVVVVGLRPVDNSDYFGYVVFERGTSNFPVFGENTTDVTVYVFRGLSTRSDSRGAGTPTAEAGGTPES
ncbi:MAG: hypothetical protein M3Q03_12295 [Chloroflexota bacterium]|nr:hypothetical protein [Chloroflexota bacterium]